MMKKAFMILLLMLMVLPALLQVMPYGVGHALHQAKVHHAQNDHGHDHNSHQYSYHGHDAYDEDHDAIDLDIVTFYNEYLHVDLQHPSKVLVKSFDQDNSFDVVLNVTPISSDELSFSQSRAPPDGFNLRVENTPLYLSTLRLRI